MVFERVDAEVVPTQVARWRVTLTPLLNLLLFPVAIWVVDRVLAEYKYERSLAR